jgi:6-phosphogluconolactonase
MVRALVNTETLIDAEAVARRGAEVLAAEAHSAIDARGVFALAVSGGSTPWRMLALFAGIDIPWRAVHVFQVDERLVPADDPDRNLTRLIEVLGDAASLACVHAMPVEAPDPGAAADDYAAVLAEITGEPPVLDLVHLGLGADGHTASLVPGDPVLEVRDRDVAVTAMSYGGRRRMTLTFPALARARRILWVVTGGGKRGALGWLLAGDSGIPASRVDDRNALLLVDRAAVRGENQGR